MKGVPVACKDGEWFTHGAGRGGTPEIEVVEDGIVGSPRTAASNAFRRDVAPARSASVGNGLHTLSPSYTLSSPVGNIGHSGKGSAFSTAWTKFFGYVLYVKYFGAAHRSGGLPAPKQALSEVIHRLASPCFHGGSKAKNGGIISACERPTRMLSTRAEKALASVYLVHLLRLAVFTRTTPSASTSKHAQARRASTLDSVES